MEQMFSFFHNGENKAVLSQLVAWRGQMKLKNLAKCAMKRLGILTTYTKMGFNSKKLPHYTCIKYIIISKASIIFKTLLSYFL